MSLHVLHFFMFSYVVCVSMKCRCLLRPAKIFWIQVRICKSCLRCSHDSYIDSYTGWSLESLWTNMGFLLRSCEHLFYFVVCGCPNFDVCVQCVVIMVLRWVSYLFLGCYKLCYDVSSLCYHVYMLCFLWLSYAFTWISTDSYMNLHMETAIWNQPTEANK